MLVVVTRDLVTSGESGLRPLRALPGPAREAWFNSTQTEIAVKWGNGMTPLSQALYRLLCGKVAPYRDDQTPSREQTLTFLRAFLQEGANWGLAYAL